MINEETAWFLFLDRGHRDRPCGLGRSMRRSRRRVPTNGGAVRVQRGRGWTMVCAESLAWLLRQRPGSFHALITDPPYSSGGFVRSDRMLAPTKKYLQTGSSLRAPDFAGDNRDQRAFTMWSTLWLGEALRTLVLGAPACVWSDWRQLPATTDALQAGGFIWRGVAVWTKRNNSRPQRGRFRADAEFVVWGSRGPMPPERGVGVLRGSWEASPVRFDQRRHITEKPVSIMRRIVEIAGPGSRVLDPFAGSASTGVACLQTGREFVGVEQDEEIFRGACERLREVSRSERGRRAS